MQLVLIVLMAVMVGASGYVVVRAVRIGRQSTARSLSAVSRYGYDAPAPMVFESPKPQNLTLEKSLARIAGRLSREDYEQRLKLRLLQAGMYGTRPSRFLMVRLMSLLVFASIGMLRASSTSNHFLAVAEIVIAPFLGWMLPDTLLSSRISRRQKQIERDGADMIDLLAITVHAGLGLDQALRVTSERLSGPLADEVRLMLNEIRVGQSRQEALRRLSERVDTPTIRSFSRSIAQSESMGVSISQILKALAVESRARKKAVAEEHAQKAPIKMVFPLAVCLFPAILIVAAGPGLLSVIHTLRGT
jgi:tight adherence protein C